MDSFVNNREAEVGKVEISGLFSRGIDMSNIPYDKKILSTFEILRGYTQKSKDFHSPKYLSIFDKPTKSEQFDEQL